MKRTTTTLPDFSGVVFALAAAVSWSACDGGSKTAGTNEEPTPCRLNSECDRAYVCSDGFCLPECQEDRDCNGDEVCWWPDYGCLPPGEEPPQATPPRDVEFDPDTGVDIQFDGCELDSDCDPGLECKDGQCATVQSGSECEWTPGEPMVSARLLSVRPSVLSHGDHGRYACLAIARAGDDPAQLFLFSYAGNSLTSVRVEMSGARDRARVSCLGVGGAGSAFKAVVAIDNSAVAYTVSADGNATASSWLDLSTPAKPGDAGRLIIDGSGRLVFFWTHVSWSYGVVWDSYGGWSQQFSHSGPQPTAAARYGAPVFSNRRLDGVSWGTTETIAPDHVGLELHSRGETEFGWFSFSGTELYYSVGKLGGPWSTESTGIVDDFTTDIAEFRSDSAFDETVGEPLLVYARGDGLLRYVTRKDGSWVSGDTRFQSGSNRTVDVKAKWVGCGRPAAELIAWYPPAGWDVYEAR